MDLLPSLDEIRASQTLVYSLLQPTPQISWPLLNARLGAEVWVKHENHTPVGAFKARTAIVYVADLARRANGIRGLITATRGNHGQGVAVAGQRFQVPVTIVVPIGNSVEKNAAMRAQGAKLVEFGKDFQEAREHAAGLARDEDLAFVPPYHRDIVKSVASYWVELFSAVPDLDVVYVPIGMGSGISAGCAVRNAMGLRTKIVGVVAAGAPAYALSVEAGRKIEAPVTTTIADGMACRLPDDEPLEIIRQNADHLVVVDDQEIRQAMKIYFTHTHNVVEGAGAAPLAAALKEKASFGGKRVALILTGGNVDHEVFAQVLLDGARQ
ncbi:MAG: threonine dehydratase [Acidobacteria bacterium]|nr:threonine dehydratase [Acidobacteriota bacterium]MBV9624313.1 threonine dehydratase [Acidobacteriota bacterium]